MNVHTTELTQWTTKTDAAKRMRLRPRNPSPDERRRALSVAPHTFEWPCRVEAGQLTAVPYRRALVGELELRPEAKNPFHEIEELCPFKLARSLW